MPDGGEFPRRCALLSREAVSSACQALVREGLALLGWTPRCRCELRASGPGYNACAEQDRGEGRRPERFICGCYARRTSGGLALGGGQLLHLARRTISPKGSGIVPLLVSLLYGPPHLVAHGAMLSASAGFPKRRALAGPRCRGVAALGGGCAGGSNRLVAGPSP